ncbi:XdhC family protein [Dethiobacter alkaliphilus]|uniref:XdhC family protein n=1 Tax=Dethiobacter alkaliphilus TaxID=427926 RepID=UPI0022263BBE|nr:XdhC/CoxI family protein [Dethiobacter alkaliphilus]MCW3490016.1 XdhC family protein [Dethiobacter alkaliphilus]
MEVNLKSALIEVCSSNDAAALVTIIRVQGSAPRKPGAKMLVCADGRTFGTIGGGCGEAEVRREALHALDALCPTKYVVNMTQELAAEEGMVCGGVMEVLIDILPPGKSKEKSMLLSYLKELERKKAPTLITGINIAKEKISAHTFFVTSAGEVRGSTGVGFSEERLLRLAKSYQHNRMPSLVTEGQIQFYIEPVQPAVKLVILGGGHIAQPLCAIASILDYDITVIDDRPQFANRSRFACAEKVICDDFLQGIDRADLTEDSYIVIVTRGHRHDKLCLKAVIDKPVAYIGMIGSKRRVKALMDEIIEEGIAPEAVHRVNSPIGLNIDAQTPEEIAVSILAEIISVHRSTELQ